jgi:nitrite reductase/ring-hydroxylating ferredoxin subunit
MNWHRVLAADELPEGRVATVAAGHKSVALVHYDGQFSALDNRCPHQGGPLGEGSIENGLLRCPWHGFDYCPLDGRSPGFDDEATTYPLEIRDGEIYVGVEPPVHVTTVTDVMVETMVNWGVEHVFGMVGHSNLGLADALRRQEEAGRLQYIGIRHEGAAAFAASAFGKLTGRPAACLTIAGPGATNLLTGLWDAKVDRAPVLALTGQVNSQVLGPGAFQEVDLSAAFGAAILDAFAGDTASPVRLWPEHFDIAIEMGEINYGFSPGDEHHAEPYAYVGPWTAPPAGELWNATGFAGAELTYAELMKAEDPRLHALDFLTTRRDALA